MRGRRESGERARFACGSGLLIDWAVRKGGTGCAAVTAGQNEDRLDLEARQLRAGAVEEEMRWARREREQDALQYRFWAGNRWRRRRLAPVVIDGSSGRGWWQRNGKGSILGSAWVESRARGRREIAGFI
ncbi:hypothetical protein M0R45_007154 [Rubus argutus]|uniref:Uncharacterized protein n=1 Tax=Rubus argutus TaxID=59490 RepID=A0AAW1YTC4_RUBAR